MEKIWRRLALPLLLVLGICFIEAGFTANYVDARSMSGGRMFKSTPYRAPVQKMRTSPNMNNRGSFSRGMAGGLLGGALGGLLFGSMFGMGGSGMGLLPLLLLAGVGYMLYKKFSQPQGRNYRDYSRYQGQTGPPPGAGFPGNNGPASGGSMGSGFGDNSGPPPVPPTPDIGSGLKADGLAQIRQHEPGFDESHFLEVASDVFFQVQAGWMRRDLDSYRHLLGDTLAGEYAKHFEEMRRKGHINKLESIAIRNVEIIEAGSDGHEDFVTVLFTANLLDYTVDDKSGDLVEGSMTTPVKFREEWSWARPVGTQNWKLEGIK